MKVQLIKILFVFICLFALTNDVHSSDVWWEECDGDWFDLDNWSLRISGTQDDVYINNECGGPTVNDDVNTGTIYIGYDAPDNEMTQIGDFNVRAIDMYLGYYEGSTGTYHHHSSGQLKVGLNLNVGNYGTGIFEQHKGQVESGLRLGYEAPGTGTYRLFGGSVTGIKANLYVGWFGTGIFEHKGGDVDFREGVLYVFGKSSQYVLDEGNLTVRNAHIRHSSSNETRNSFTQKGGNVTCVDPHWTECV